VAACIPTVKQVNGADVPAAESALSYTSSRTALAASGIAAFNNPPIETQLPWFLLLSPRLRFDTSFREPHMKSSRLAVTVVALVLTLTALDLSGAHQPQAMAPGHSRGGNALVVAPTPVRINVDHVSVDGEELEGRVVQTFLLAEQASAGRQRAAHLCADSGGNQGNAARYCFGTPAPTLQYD